MIQSPSKNTVDMLYEREITLVKVILLSFVAMIESNFLAIVY